MAYFQHGRNILRQGKILKDSALIQTSDRVFHHPLLYAIQGIRYRKLEVILTTTIDKLGKAGETVKVAPGHFRNHLMPKLLAVPNIDKFAYLISEQRKRGHVSLVRASKWVEQRGDSRSYAFMIYEPKEAEEVKVVPKTVEDTMKEYQTAATRLDNAKLVLRRFVKIDKDLRSPVEKEEIVAEVARQLGIRIEPENLQLTTPLSTLGEFEVPLRLPKAIPLPEGKVQWTLDVKIRKK